MKAPRSSQYVFLSYAHTDSKFAMRLKTDLQSQGITVWIDQDGIDLGTPDWEDALRTAIRAAHAVLLVASPSSRNSRYVKDELRIAAMYQRSVYPVWIAGGEWMDAIPLGLGGTQYVDAREERYATAVGDIVKILRHVINRPPSTHSVISASQRDFEPRNPYKGLHAFTSDDAHDFFGRDNLINELVAALKASLLAEKKSGQSPRLLAVVGPSGSGKSSVVLAGLLPQLQQGALPSSEQWIYLNPMKPGAYPIEELMLVLSDGMPIKEGLKALYDDLQDEEARGLYWHASRLISPPAAKVVLVVDQFEELFTQTASEGERQHFINLLINAVTEPRSPVIVIVTLRADFSDRPMHYPELSRLIDAQRISVLPMELQDLRRVIEQPAMLPDVQLTFESDLVGDLLFEMQGQIGALPLLQFTLDQLFQRRSGHQLTLQSYREIGGVKGALAKHAEATYALLPSEEHRRLARTLFVRLIDPGASEQDTTRRRATLSEFTFDDVTQTCLLRETMDTFIAARLLTTNVIAGTTTIEVSHETVIQEWRRLAGWLREGREDIRLQQTLSSAAAEWQRHKKPADRLYRGSQLKEARTWAKRNIPSKNEVAFLHASILYKVRFVVSIIAVFLIVISSTGIAGWILTHQPPKTPNPTQVTNLQDDGVGSLRWAINNLPPGSTITFPGLKGTIILTSDLLITKKNLTIHGPGARRLTISNSTHQIHVFSGASINMFDLTFAGSTSNPASLLINEGTLTLTNSVISGNTANEGRGGSGTAPGGIDNSGTLTLTNSTVSGNSASGEGSTGGIGNNGTLILTNSTVSGNSAADGGGIFNSGVLTLTNSTVSDNAASFGGGGIFSASSAGSLTLNTTVTLINSTISGNTATGKNGGIGDGGGIYNDNGSTFTLTNSTVSGNTASGGKGDGGGIFNTNTLTLTNSTVSNNTASVGNGGGIANVGGGIANSTLTLTNSTISGNTASGDGGGVDNSGGKAVIEFCTIYSNKTTGNGGGLSSSNSTDNSGQITPDQVRIRNSIIAGDHAPSSPDISGTLTSDGYNLIQNLSGATFAPNKQHNTDLSGDNFPTLGIDPLLRDNGGLAKLHTFTHVLLSGSPAIDIIPLDACHVNRIMADQRGVKRPDGNENGCDIGAYESIG